MRIPTGMRRPAATGQALGFRLLVEARGADASCVERVPLVSAGAKPFVSLRGDQPHSGHRMRGGSDVPGFFSCSRSRSGTMTGLSATGLMLAIYALRPDYLSSVRRFTEALAQHQPYSAATAYSAL